MSSGQSEFDLNHPLRRVRLDLIDPHFERAKLQMTRGDYLRSFAAFVDAWMSIVDREIPGGPVMTTPLAAIEAIDVRLLNTLEEHGRIETVGELMQTSGDELEQLPNFGKVQHVALLEAIARHLLDRCRLLESLTSKHT